MATTVVTATEAPAATVAAPVVATATQAPTPQAAAVMAAATEAPIVSGAASEAAAPTAEEAAPTTVRWVEAATVMAAMRSGPGIEELLVMGPDPARQPRLSGPITVQIEPRWAGGHPVAGGNPADEERTRGRLLPRCQSGLAGSTHGDR